MLLVLFQDIECEVGVWLMRFSAADLTVCTTPGGKATRSVWREQKWVNQLGCTGVVHKGCAPC